MEEQDILKTEEVAENVETTTEEIPQEVNPPKTYTQEEVDAIVSKKKARTRAQVEREYRRKYGDLEDVLKAGTGTENVVELTDTFREFYKGKGIAVDSKPQYSDRDIEILAKVEAEDTIRSGMEDVEEEVERLAAIGVDKMTPREKEVFRRLVDYHRTEKRNGELAKIGVKPEVYESAAFKEFAGQFHSDVPITKVYKMYAKENNISPTEKIGSMKNGGQTGEKKFYTPDEVDRLTAKDFDNPRVMQAVRESMKRWK